jgi:hypothetical protein
MEAAIMVKSALENARRMKKNCYLMPIDFANVFGAAHEVILYAMRAHGIPKYIKDFVKSLIWHVKNCIQSGYEGHTPYLHRLDRSETRCSTRRQSESSAL